MGPLVHLRFIVHHTQRRHHTLRNIKLVHLVVPNLMLVMSLIKVTWDLGQPTLTPIKLIVGLMVTIFCDLRVGNICLRVIHTEKCTILHYIFGGRIIVLMLSMLNLLLVLG